MRRHCAGSLTRPLGVFLFAAGLIILICALPFWFWMVFVGAVLAALGAFLFKIG